MEYYKQQKIFFLQEKIHPYYYITKKILSYNKILKRLLH